MLMGWMVYLIGVVVGMVAMYALLYKKKSGVLMIDKSSKEIGSNLYVVLDEEIEKLENKKSVIFNIKIIH